VNAPGDASGIVSNYSNNLATTAVRGQKQEANSAPAVPSRGTGEIAESDDFSSKTSRTDDGQVDGAHAHRRLRRTIRNELQDFAPASALGFGRLSGTSSVREVFD